MDSRTYWKNREEEQRKKNIEDEAEYAKEIEKIYVNMMDEIQKEINGFYARYAKAEGITIAEAKKRVSKMDIDAYSRKAAQYVKDKNFSKEANEEMRLYNAAMKINRLEMLKANIGMHLVGGFDELQKYFEQILTGKTLEEFERQAGILGKTIQNNAKMAHSIVNASFHNAKYSDRIWMYQDMLKAELSKLLQTGLIQGKNPRVLARHLERRFGVSLANAERLMATELSRVQAEAQKQSYIRNGFDEYEFIAEPTACSICRALDGKHFKVSKMMPGENAHPMHPRCRCSTAAYMDDKEYREWLDGYSKHGMNFETWKSAKGIRKRYKDNEKNFTTFDGRSPQMGKDIIKPKNIMKEMRKSQIGTDMLQYILDNDVPVNIWYGVDVEPELAGMVEDGEINIYADNTKNIKETATTVIHEATHVKINKPNSKNQELECYMNEYRHRGIELTDEVIDRIMKHIDDKYKYLEWE